MTGRNNAEFWGQPHDGHDFVPSDKFPTTEYECRRCGIDAYDAAFDGYDRCLYRDSPIPVVTRRKPGRVRKLVWRLVNALG